MVDTEDRIINKLNYLILLSEANIMTRMREFYGHSVNKSNESSGMMNVIANALESEDYDEELRKVAPPHVVTQILDDVQENGLEVVRGHAKKAVLANRDNAKAFQFLGQNVTEALKIVDKKLDVIMRRRYPILARKPKTEKKPEPQPKSGGKCNICGKDAIFSQGDKSACREHFEKVFPRNKGEE